MLGCWTLVLIKHTHISSKLWVLLEWIPGHHGIENDEQAHSLANVDIPNVPLHWPQVCAPKACGVEHQKLLRARLTGPRISHAPTTPSYLLPRAEASLRQSQTLTVPTDAIIPGIERRSCDTLCQVCVRHPNAVHTYCECPRALSSRSRAVAHAILRGRRRSPGKAR